jgi:linoleoyl-CoA desaturase
MVEHRQFKYTHDVTSSAFSKALSQRVDDYFRERHISKHANLEMISKSILGFAATIAAYAWLMTDRFGPIEVVGVYVLLGFAQLYMAFNIAHDANHGAYSSSRRVNRVLSCVFDLVGVSSYMWRLFHNVAHHAFVNIRGADTTLVSGNIFRFSPHDERKPHHRYQHLYASFFYCLSSLDWVLTKDFRWLFSTTPFGNRRTARHPTGELILLFGAKAFYYTYMLVIPMLYLSVPWYSIVAGFVVLHFFMGFTIALIFQPNHFNENATFPEADEDGHISNNYIQHIFDTTSDYARSNAFANWILGCLNLHVIHHMFPGICHVHYVELTKIVKSTAEEYGLRYRENRTITGAFLAHLRWLKALGNADAA